MGFMEMLNGHLEDAKKKGSSGGSSGGSGGNSSASTPKYVGTGHEAFYNNAASKNVFNKNYKNTFDAPVSKKLTSSYKKKKQEEEEDDHPIKVFQKGALKEGITVGSVSKAILGTTADAGLSAVRGIAGLGEGIGDALVYGAAEVVDLFGNDDRADELRENASVSQVERLTGGAAEWLDQYSVIGRSVDGALQGVGQAFGLAGATAAIAATAPVSVPAVIISGGLMALSGIGQGYTEAYQGGATEEEARKHALNMGVSEAVPQLLFGAMGKAAKMSGLSKGLTNVDDVIAVMASKKFKSQAAKNLVEAGVKMSSEGLEEVISGALQAVSKYNTYMSEEDFGKILKDENLAEQFFAGALTAGIMQSGYVPGMSEGSLREANKAGRDFITGQSQNEQAVIKKELENRIAEAEKDGTKLTNKQKADLEEKVVKDMEKGYISTDTIIEAIGGEKYNQYKQAADWESSLQTEYDTLSKEYDELYNMKNGEKSSKQVDREAELKEMLPDLKKKLDNVKATSTLEQQKAQLTNDVYEMSKSDRLVESFFENVRTKQKFDADLSKYDEKQRQHIQDAIDSGVLHNGNRSHEIVDYTAKVSADTGLSIKYSNTAKLKADGLHPKRTIDLQADGSTTEFDLGVKNLDEGFKPVVKVGSDEVSNYKVDFENGKITFDSAPTGDVSVTVEGSEVVDSVYTKDGIILNVESPKYLEALTGHEVGHSFEKAKNYNNLFNAVKAFAEAKGEWEDRVKYRESTHNGIENADPEREAVNDLLGEYLFQGSDFIMDLSVNHRNVFQKIFDEIKYLCKVATAGSKEARRLEAVKHEFEKVYREVVEAQTDTKYSVSQQTKVQFTPSEIQTIQNVGRKSVNAFTSSDIAATEKFAKQYWKEMGTKSPFYRAWFGDWRGKDTTPVQTATKQGDTRGTQRNTDTGWDIQISGKVFSETKAHNGSYNIAAKPYLPYINDIVEKAVLLDSYGVDPAKPKSPNSMLMHSMYAVADIGNGPEVLKLYVEEMNNPNSANTTKRGYQLQNIEKYRPVGKSSQNAASSISPTVGSAYTVADLFAHVKSLDNNFTPNQASKIINADGTPKVMYHGSKAQFTEFDRSKAKSSGLYGKGFYFTDSESHAGTYGNQYKVYLNIRNPLQSGGEIITRNQVRSYLESVADNEDYSIENYGTYDIDEILNNVMGKDRVVDAFKLIQDVNATAIGDMVEATELFNSINGTTFDGIVVPTETVAFYPEQIKSATDNIGTFDKNNPDIRYSLSESESDQNLSLSNTDEQAGQSGYRATLGKDVSLQAEDVAPTAEESSFDAPTVSKTESVSEEAPIYESNDKSAPEGQTAMFEPVEGEKKQTRKEYHQDIIDNIKDRFDEKGFDFDKVLKGAKNLSTWSTVDNTPQRVMEKSLGYKEGGILADITVNKVAQNESEGIKWLNSYVDQLKQISKQYHIKPGSKESAAAQMFAEGFYVNENNEIIRYGEPELIQDFKDPKVRANIKGLARDPRIRKIYDDTLGNINESRARNLYPEIPRLDNYFLHFRAMEDTFSTLGLPFNPNDIRAKDLPTDLNGVTADLKPGQPYFASANHRTGKRTSFDLLGGVERYLNSAKNQIYHIDDIQTLRALRNYIAETYGQASGLEDIDSMTDAEAEERIKQVYDSHLSTFAKFLNEEANVLAGKTALVDRGIEGLFGRRAMTFLNTLKSQVGSNMVGGNVSSSLTNFMPVAQTFAKANKFDFTKAFAQTVANKISGGRLDTFAQDSPVVIRRKGTDRFAKTMWQKMAEPGYVLMGAVDDISTEIVARTKYNELTRKGMDSQKAHFETDKWVSKLMGDRSLGQQPQLYNSKMFGLLTQFQLEVRNQLDMEFYDTYQEAKASNEQIENALLRNAKTAAKTASVIAQLTVAQHLYGKAFEAIAGYNPAFDIIEVLMTAFGYDDEEDSEDTALDNLSEALLALAEDLPYTSIFTGGRIPISAALPDVNAVLRGEDEYGNEIGVPKAAWEEMKDIAPYYVMPTGYGQAKKTYQGLKMFSDDHPISGSYTDAGNLRYPVEDTVVNKIQAGLFGQYANKNAQKYFDEEQKTLNPEQTEIFAGLNIPIEEYWEYRDKYNEFKDVKNKVLDAAYADGATDEDVIKGKYIKDINSELNDLYEKQQEIASGNSRGKTLELRQLQKQMEQLISDSKYGVDNAYVSGIYAEVGGRRYDYNVDKKTWYEIKPKKSNGEDNWYYQMEQKVTKDFGISYEEYWNNSEEYNFAYNNPKKYSVAKAIGGYDFYQESYDILQNWKSDNYIRADKDAKGNSISGSRKKKVQDYINGLDLDYGEKIILYRTVYSSKDDKKAYNQEIIDYLNERSDISYQDMKNILEELDFEVDDEGYIKW